MELEFYETEIACDYGAILTIIHNLPFEGEGNIKDVFREWALKHESISEHDFCASINETREQGLTNYYAFTKYEFEGLAEIGAVERIGKPIIKKEFVLNGKNYELEIKLPHQITNAEKDRYYPLPGDVLIRLFGEKDFHAFVMSPMEGNWQPINSGGCSKKLTIKIAELISEALSEPAV